MEKTFLCTLIARGTLEKSFFQDITFESPIENTMYEINDKMAEVLEIWGQNELSVKLATEEASGRLIISPGREIKLRFEPDDKNVVDKVGLVLAFPLETEFHIPENRNLGRKIDRDMPVGESYPPQSLEEYIPSSVKLGYNFFLANFEGMWIRFMVKQPNFYVANLSISRHPELFIVSFTWKKSDDVFIRVFSSIDQATKDYEYWLENEFNVKKLRDDPAVPEWIHNVKLILTVDMMRSNWEITHDYNDVKNLARDLEAIGCPKDTIFYIPGWNGAYDSTYPTYRPHPDLGGEVKFKEMMETLHKNGFRVMIHTNAWGLDPYHPEIEKFLKYARRDKDGNYIGWLIGGPKKTKGPLRRPLRYHSDRVPFNILGNERSFAFQTICVPDSCEAAISIGNLDVGAARVRFTIDKRSMLTPEGWFKEHKEYLFPFTFMLKPGKNKVHVEVIGEAEPDWSESWYRIHYCQIPRDPFNVLTFPILNADTGDSEWIKIFVNNVESVVNDYGIDAVHVDATGYEGRARALLDELKRRLRNIPLGAENLSSVQGLGYWTLSQGARQSMLVDYMSYLPGLLYRNRRFFPNEEITKELYNWLDKPSPVCDFVKDYICIYPHLCIADAFVPVGRVCNISSPNIWPLHKEDLWKVIHEVRRLNCIPGLRVNYRKYGLDEETKNAIQEIASTKL